MGATLLYLKTWNFKYTSTCPLGYRLPW